MVLEATGPPPTVLVVQRRYADFRAAFFSALRRKTRWDVLIAAATGDVPGDGVRAVEDAHTQPVVERQLGPVFWLAGVLRLVRQLRPDVVILEANPRLLSNPFLMLGTKLIGVPTILWGLGRTERERSLAVDRVAAAAMRVQGLLADGAIGYGDQAAAYYRRIVDGPVVVAPNSTMQLSPNRRAKTSVPEPRSLVYLGKLEPQKCILELLEAWKEAPPGVELKVHGAGSLHDEVEERCRSLVGCHFLGALPRDQVADVLRDATFVVMPGTGGLVAHESLAVGTPLLLHTDAGDGTLDIAGATTYGYIEGGARTAACKRLIERATAVTDARYREMSQAALAVAGDRGGLDEMVQGFESIVRLLAERK